MCILPRISVFLMGSKFVFRTPALDPYRHKLLGYHLETDPDLIAMVIKVELFIYKPCRQKTPVT